MAGGMPIATGVALSMKMQAIDRVCLCIFGDGAANEGAFHESLNLAAVWDLPVVFLCEHNQYGMSMSSQRAMRIESVAQRAGSYGIPGEMVDGNNVLAVYVVFRSSGTRSRRPGSQPDREPHLSLQRPCQKRPESLSHP